MWCHAAHTVKHPVPHPASSSSCQSLPSWLYLFIVQCQHTFIMCRHHDRSFSPYRSTSSSVSVSWRLQCSASPLWFSTLLSERFSWRTASVTLISSASTLVTLHYYQFHNTLSHLDLSICSSTCLLVRVVCPCRYTLL